MALRPLAFSVRLRDKDRGRTLHIRNDATDTSRYVLEDASDDGETRTRRHASAGDAVRDAAQTWRNRLN